MGRKPKAETTTTVSFNGGEHIPLEKLDAATAKLKIGHNSGIKPGGIARDQLRSVVERIERLEEEKAGIAADIKDVFAEAKGNGYDIPTLRKILSLRKQDAAKREEADHLLDTYKRALGMQPDLFDEGEANQES